MIAAAAAMVLVSCKKTENESKPDLKVTVTPTEVAVSSTGNIEVALTSALEKDITVSVSASGDFITLAESSVKIAKGETKGSVSFTAKAAGDVTVTASCAEANTGTATLKVIAGDPGKDWAELCEIGYPVYGAYGSLGWAKMGDTTIEGDELGNAYYLGENVPLNSALSVEFLPYGASGQTGATDQYVVLVFADWNNSGKLKQIATSENFDAGSAASTKSFTLEIPADAGEIGTIRVLSTFVDPEYGTLIDDEGCGTVESGNIFDIQFVNNK